MHPSSSLVGLLSRLRQRSSPPALESSRRSQDATLVSYLTAARASLTVPLATETHSHVAYPTHVTPHFGRESVPRSIDPLNLTGRIVKKGKAVAAGPCYDVYHGELGPSNSPVAINVLRAPWDEPWTEQILQRIQEELPGWTTIQHPRVIAILGYAVIDGEIAVITGRCPNGTIMDYIRLNPLSSRMALVRHVAEGLRHLHTRDEPIVHGDLNPRTILVNVNGQAMISDFRALSKIMTGGMNEDEATGDSHTDIRYSAPELMSDDPCTTHSDVYAFACVALTMLTDQVPFVKVKNGAAVLLAKQSEQQPSPKDHPTLPLSHPIWAVLQKCWHADRKRRPTMSQVLTQLDSM